MKKSFELGSLMKSSVVARLCINTIIRWGLFLVLLVLFCAIYFFLLFYHLWFHI